MPRLLANEYVYSTAAADERYNDYVTPTTPPLQLYQMQRHQSRQQHSQDIIEPGASSSKSGSHSPPSQNMEIISAALVSDESPLMAKEPTSSRREYVIEPHTAFSDDDEAFEGFDDNERDISGENLMRLSEALEIVAADGKQMSLLKRHLQHEYHEDSEGVVEAIEVDDDEDIEEIDGQILLKSKQQTSPIDVDPHTPNKRKKRQSKEAPEDVLSPTQPDQIVEINSDSTTVSLKQKRHRINAKFHLNFSPRQTSKQTNTAAAANKCSTESTSEFPVSSPSNPQLPRGGGKYPPRPPLLKNTLSVDSFERQLAMITACNPQMTLTEKIKGWCCDEDTSDVEDVNIFDNEFKRLEEKRKRDIRKYKCKRAAGGTENHSDFLAFKQKIINNMKNLQHRRYLAGSGAMGSSSAGGNLKDINSTGSDSSKSEKLNDERPSTSAMAQQQLQMRRAKLPNIYLQASEAKKRFSKDISKRNQNSTTPPATSSSETDRECFQSSKPLGLNKRFSHHSAIQQSLHIHDKLLCPSSSEEANSQDEPLDLKKKAPQDKRSIKNFQCAGGEEIDSVFRLHRLNREIDKSLDDGSDIKDEQPKEKPKNIYNNHTDVEEEVAIIESDENKFEIDFLKKQGVFKTPIIPPKYLANITAMSADFSNSQECSSFLQSHNVCTDLKTPQDVEDLKPNSVPLMEINSSTKPKVKLENRATETDFDGVYHQQHEFCNYLGLTGMSTATAMANAVAELAQCNLTRRSMRVLRQQQQERREKSAKEDREVMSLKAKQLKEFRKRRERGGYDAPIESEESMLLCEEGTNSQTSEPTRSTTPVSASKKNNVVETLSPKTLTPTVIKIEPQIKILCHIATSDKKDTEKISQEPVEKIKQPTRQTLIRRSRPRNNFENVNHNKIFDVKQDNILNKKTDGSLSGDDLKLEDISVSVEKCALNLPRFSPSRRAKLKKTKLEVFIFDKNKVNEQNKMERSNDMENKTSLNQDKYNLAALNNKDVKSETQIPSQVYNISSPLHQKDNKTKDLQLLDEKTNSTADKEYLDECDRSLTPTAPYIKEKLEAALVESRKTKPSIFIVQSFVCMKEKETKPVSISQHAINTPHDIKPLAVTQMQPLKTSPLKTFPLLKPSPTKIDIRQQMFDKPVKSQTELNDKAVITKKKRKKYLKSRHKVTGKAANANNKRKLRSHKLLYIKTSKSDDKVNTKITADVKKLRSHNKKILAAKQQQQKSSSRTPEVVENNVKSYRNAQTETKDLETYNNKAKTRLMAKASELLQRSRQMSITRAYSNSINLRSQMFRPTINRMKSKPKLQPKQNKFYEPTMEYKTSTISLNTPPSSFNELTLQYPNTEYATPLDIKTATGMQPPQKSAKYSVQQETENVVVSSTTNSFDERPPLMSPPITTTNVAIAPTPLITKDSWTQMEHNQPQGIQYLNNPPSATHIMRNPLQTDQGAVLYIYYEVDILIVVQERLISFWKCSRLLNTLSVQKASTGSEHGKASTPTPMKSVLLSADLANTSSSTSTSPAVVDMSIREPALLSSSSLESAQQINGQWIMLGELRRLTYDLEVFASYANRICIHNSTPIYVEMRAKSLPKRHRDCNLLSMYINIYFYHDEDVVAKINSIQLDTIQSDFKAVNYTTLKDSRYLVMTWPQENHMGKTCSGLCKYSLTPQLDSLASIREFKSMRHTIKYLECMSDDKLIGFGDTQLTVWDHRSGDVLMNYDLDIPLGKNLGSVYYRNQDIEQNNMILLFQWRDTKPDESPELLVIACTINHVQPSYRLLLQQSLPMAFKNVKRAINTGDHVIITCSEKGLNEVELWINCGNPALMALIPASRMDCKRFYNRERSQLIELTEKSLNLDTVANHNLKLSAGLAFNSM